MRVAIVGGGAAGMATAYLLDGRHEVTVFEAASVLGGHVRTLGGNVPCAGLEPGCILDAGVIEFDEHHFPTVGRLLDALGVERRPVPCTTTLSLADGRHFRSRGNIARGGEGPLARTAATLRLLPVGIEKRAFERRTEGLDPAALDPHAIGHYLRPGPYALWLRMLLMYAYSIPYPETAAIPAALAVPVLRAFTNSTRWTAIRGGTYTYLQRILETIEARVVLDARIVGVTRSAEGVEIRLSEGEALPFDAVVFATPPDQVLGLLTDPTPAETERFSPWRANRIQTVIHTDAGLQARRGIRYFAEFDLFETAEGEGGYSAYLNRLAGLPPDHATHYFLAYGLEKEIDPARVLHVQPHHTPGYTVEAFAQREAVLAAQGENRTYHVGAWLGNGLHEGAVASALRVSEQLGGRGL